MFGNCDGGNCGFSDSPPPDTILSMPPPPLPSFLLPKTAMLALPANDSHPCFTLTCDPSPNARAIGIDFVELIGENASGMENTWLFVLISSVVGVLILGGLFAIILLKCRDALFSTCNLAYHDTSTKQGNIAMCEPIKANPFLAGGILYPCPNASPIHNHDTMQLTNDSRLLWATLTPHGTRHFISDYNGPDSGHYEVVDYRLKGQGHIGTYREHIKRTPIKTFDNNGFIDYDYEDPTPLMDSYHDDLDSGYQEPQEVIGSMQRGSPRQFVSSPTPIDNPNIPPLNYYPTSYRSTSGNSTCTLQSNNSGATLNHKATLGRRISDVSSSSSSGPNM